VKRTMRTSCRRGFRCRGSLLLVYLLMVVSVLFVVDRTLAQDFEDDEESFAFDEDMEHNANDFLFRHVSSIYHSLCLHLLLMDAPLILFHSRKPSRFP